MAREMHYILDHEKIKAVYSLENAEKIHGIFCKAQLSIIQLEPKPVASPKQVTYVYAGQSSCEKAFSLRPVGFSMNGC